MELKVKVIESKRKVAEKKKKLPRQSKLFLSSAAPHRNQLSDVLDFRV
jgi:hypothetical protein